MPTLLAQFSEIDSAFPDAVAIAVAILLLAFIIAVHQWRARE